MILKLSVNNQSVESSGITKDYKDALCEYVWNSFEANATAVAIDCIPNELTGSAEIVSLTTEMESPMIPLNAHLVHSSILKRTADPCKSKQRQTRAKDDSRVFPLHPWLNGRR